MAESENPPLPVLHILAGLVVLLLLPLVRHPTLLAVSQRLQQTINDSLSSLFVAVMKLSPCGLLYSLDVLVVPGPASASALANGLTHVSNAPCDYCLFSMSMVDCILSIVRDLMSMIYCALSIAYCLCPYSIPQSYHCLLPIVCCRVDCINDRLSA